MEVRIETNGLNDVESSWSDVREVEALPRRGDTVFFQEESDGPPQYYEGEVQKVEHHAALKSHPDAPDLPTLYLEEVRERG